MKQTEGLMKKIISLCLLCILSACAEVGSDSTQKNKTPMDQKIISLENCEKIGNKLTLKRNYTRKVLIKKLSDEYSQFSMNLSWDNYLFCLDQKNEIFCDQNECNLKEKI